MHDNLVNSMTNDDKAFVNSGKCQKILTARSINLLVVAFSLVCALVGEKAIAQIPQTVSTPTQTATDSQIPVQRIEVTGSTVFSPVQLNSIVQPFEGRTLTLSQLQEVADKITQLYLNQGYITSKAILEDQKVTNGLARIRVIEGTIGEIKIEGTQRVNPDEIRRLVQQGAGIPVNTDKLEKQLRLLRADPRFDFVEASLRGGSQLGQSILVVRVSEK